MASDSELIAAKFVLPIGTDFIYNGDDAITANARASYDHAVKQSTDKANGAIAKTRLVPGSNGLAVDSYGTTVGLLDSTGEPLGSWLPDYLQKIFVVSDTAPEYTEVDGLPVIWLDTRDPSAWKATPATIDDNTKQVTIPKDDGATYEINGVAKAPGVYPYTSTGSPISITVTAYPKDGYSLTGTRSWSGYVTAGWASLGTDSLLTGSWATGRAAFGTTYSSVTNGGTGGAITTAGLRVNDHVATTSGNVILAGNKVGQRIQVDYDVSTSVVAGSKPTVTLKFGYTSPKYGKYTTDNAGIVVGKTSEGVATLTTKALGTEAWAFDTAPGNVPVSGKLRVEVLGTSLTVYINDAQITTATIPGPATGHFLGLTVTGGVGLAKNLETAVK